MSGAAPAAGGAVVDLVELIRGFFFFSFFSFICLLCFKKRYIYHSYETFIQTFIPPFVLLSFIRSDSSVATVICNYIKFSDGSAACTSNTNPILLGSEPGWWWRCRRSG